MLYRDLLGGVRCVCVCMRSLCAPRVWRYVRVRVRGVCVRNVPFEEGNEVELDAGRQV